jgi:hypothetical protein
MSERLSSNLARKIWGMEGNGENGETVAEEMKNAKLLAILNLPTKMEDLS